ncbi:hypothetical protein [Nostoc sp. FACHB-145]|uniref:hypothetical protein n=1 Tax=Nostoc sp. FACHB-145 TaxID=2692836 RepID=UPI001684D836|nr:hypothetical protein [Nostoc sp. FACHB-145]MBD2472180.1 hypothetical protein [Nostoc sp. FACHB-145]
MLQYIKEFHPNFINSERKYMAAARLTTDLLLFNPLAIKTIRSRGIKISEITDDHLLAVCPKLPKSLAVALATPFDDWTG